MAAVGTAAWADAVDAVDAVKAVEAADVLGAVVAVVTAVWQGQWSRSPEAQGLERVYLPFPIPTCFNSVVMSVIFSRHFITLCANVMP